MKSLSKIIRGAVGAVDWHHTSLVVEALEPAMRFFENAFGYAVDFIERDMSDQIASMTGVPGLRCDLVQLRCGLSHHTLELIAFRDDKGGIPPRDPVPLRPGAAHVAFIVNDLGAATAAVQDHGAVLLGHVTEFSDGPAVYCRVPGGAFIELQEKAAAA